MKGYVRERGARRWQVAVYVGYERGRSRYRYETVSGTRRDAERRLAQLMADVNSGRLGPTRAGTLEDLVNTWWDARADQLSPTTRREYRRLLDRRILPVFGTKRVDRITPADIERYYAALRRGEAPGGGELSAASIRAVHGILRSLFKSAVRWGLVTTNPVREIDPPRRARVPLAPPLPEEVARLLARADEVDPELGMFLRLAAASGARRGELGALRWTDLDLEAGELVIGRAVVLDGEGGYVERTRRHISNAWCPSTRSRLPRSVRTGDGFPRPRWPVGSACRRTRSCSHPSPMVRSRGSRIAGPTPSSSSGLRLE